MKRIFTVICIVALCLACLGNLSACVSSDQNDYYDEYSYGYDDGYNEGYEDGWDDLFDVLYDELEVEQEEKDELLRLIFEAVVFNGEQYSGEEIWRAGSLSIKYRLDDAKTLHFYIKGFNIKDACADQWDYYDYIDTLPITCYIGYFDENGDFEVYNEWFVGEKICYDVFEFTSDGYLTDYYEINSNINTIYILLFLDGEMYTAIYKLK